MSIENVLNKKVKDTIVTAKTGEGKSLIFQVATCMLNTQHIGIAVVRFLFLFPANGAGAQKYK